MSEDIPEAIRELIGINQWVAFGADKVPIGPNGSRASSTDRATWGTLDEAKFIRKIQGLKGVGFVFDADDPYVGIDLDDAIDPVTDQLKPWAAEIVQKFGSYTEVSPGGSGVHIWVKGRLPRPGARTIVDGSSVEVYQSGRYFTVTGRPIPGCPLEIADRSQELSGWFSSMFARQERAMPSDGLTWESPPAETWIPDALAVLSPDMEEPDWRKVGAAIKAELGDAGFSLWDDWSRGSDKYPGEAACWRKWQSIDETQWAIGTLVWMAEQEGFRVPTGKAVAPEWVAKGIAQMWSNPMDEEQDRGFELELFDVLDMVRDNSPYEPDIVSPNVLGAGDLMLVFGPPKSMKSLAVTSMCIHFALGLPWLGMRPAKPLRSLIAQLEVKADNMRRRSKLLTQHLSDAQLSELGGMVKVTGRFSRDLNVEFVEEFSELAHQASSDGYDLLVIDPLTNIYTGESENDNKQMTDFLRRIKYLRNQINPDMAVILVHHANKVQRLERHSDPFNSIRGAGSLRGAYDAGMYLDRADESSGRLMAFWELRNGPGFKPAQLEFRDGEFVEVGDEVRYQVQVLLQDAADQRVTFSKSRFVKEHCHELGMHEASLGSVVSDMLKSGELIYWKPDAQHDVSLGRAKAFIGVPGMLFGTFNVTACDPPE